MNEELKTNLKKWRKWILVMRMQHHEKKLKKLADVYFGGDMVVTYARSENIMCEPYRYYE